MGIQTAVMADLPVLSQMLSQLFESSQYLDDVALHHLIDALCKLSHEAMELAYANRVSNRLALTNYNYKTCLIYLYDKHFFLLLYIVNIYIIIFCILGTLFICCGQTAGNRISQHAPY